MNHDSMIIVLIMFGDGVALGTGMIIPGGSSVGGSEIGDGERSEHTESRALRNISAVRGRPNLQVERTLFHIALQVVSHKCRMFLAPVTSYCRAELLRRDACTKACYTNWLVADFVAMFRANLKFDSICIMGQSTDH